MTTIAVVAAAVVVGSGSSRIPTMTHSARHLTMWRWQLSLTRPTVQPLLVL